jgi:putative oxidoreductase
MLSTFTPYLPIAGRVLIGAAFLFAGLRNFKNFALLEGAVKGVGMPMPRVVLFLGLLTLTISAILILTGYFLFWGGLGLALFLLIATVVFHPFWRFEGKDKVEHVNAWISNTALFGGALLLAGLSG